MQNKVLAALMALFVTTAWLPSHAVILPPPTKTITLMWDYPQLDPEIVFNVYSTTNIAAPVSQWSVVTNVKQLSCSLPLQDGNRFFTVSASNTVSGLETFSR